MAAKAHKRLDMVSEELKLIDSEAGTANRIIQGVVVMVAENDVGGIAQDESGGIGCNQDAVNGGGSNRSAMPTETREGALKMVAEAPKKL